MAETLQHTDTIQQAVTRLREALDPEKTLPDNVTFDVIETFNFDDSEPILRRDQFFIEEDGEPVGNASLVVRHDNADPEDNYAHFDGIKLHHTARGKGIGLATYIWGIEQAWQAGVPFRSQTVSQSPDAKRMWEFLQSKGIAECVEPFEFDYHRDGEDRFIGKYVIPVPK